METRVILKLDNSQKHFNPVEEVKQEPKEDSRIVKKVITKRRYQRRTKTTSKPKTFIPKTLTEEQISSSILQTPSSVKVHYDRKSKEPNDATEAQAFLNAWRRNWLGKKPQRILGRWIARAEVPGTNSTLLQGSWKYKRERVQRIIQKMSTSITMN